MTRILVKFMVFVFPAFGLLSISKDPHLRQWELRAFILYMGAVCVLLIVYEAASCCCLGKKYPEFLFEANDLKQAHEEVYSKRKEYNEMISKI